MSLASLGSQKYAGWCLSFVEDALEIPNGIEIFALQRVLAILVATIAVPTIIGNGTTQFATFFGAGVGTLVYQLFTKRKSPEEESCFHLQQFPHPIQKYYSH